MVGKKHKGAVDMVDRAKVYEIDEAVAVLKEASYAKFDETAEVAFRLGADPSKSDQVVRGTVALPHGTGKDVCILVFATGAAAEAAVAAGADHVGLEDMIAKVQGGWTDIDVIIATPEAMKEVRKLGRVLGPRGLMPNPKTGTVTDDTANAVKQFKAGRAEFRMDRNGNLMMACGKLSFSVEALRENCLAIADAVSSARPAAVKGIFIKRCTLTSTMGPGVRVNIRDKAIA